MKVLRSTVVACGLATILFVLPAGASGVPSWQNAKEVTLPTAAQGLPEGYLPVLSCVSVGNCVLGGAYSNASGDSFGFVKSETNGIWGAPVTLKAPSGAGKQPGIMIYGLSCGAVGNCAAVGDYQDSAGDLQAFVANEVANEWQSAKKVTLPQNALSVGQDAFVRSVVCPSAGNCSAIGTYLNNDVNPASLGFVTSEVNGSWRAASQIQFSGTTNINPFVVVQQIGCSSDGHCVGVGSYTDANGVNQGFLIDQVGGTWAKASTVTLPANASAFAGASLSEVGCTSSDCTVLGSYITNVGSIEALSASETDGKWQRASEIQMPTGSMTNPHVFFYGFEGIACASPGNCSFGGQYRDASGNYQGFLANEVGGTWHAATELLLPTGAQFAGANGGVVSMSCPSAGNCRAGAAYVDANGNYQALVIAESNGTWPKGTKVVLPGDASTVGVDGGIYAVVCNKVNSCTTSGSYLKTSTVYEGFTLTS